LLAATVFLAAGGAAVAGYLFYSYRSSGATVFCPRSHKFDDLVVCEVLDARGETRLIQHADLDSNETCMEIQDSLGSRFFEVPQFGQNVHILKHVQLVDSRLASVRVNNHQEALRAIPGRKF